MTLKPASLCEPRTRMLEITGLDRHSVHSYGHARKRSTSWKTIRRKWLIARDGNQCMLCLEPFVPGESKTIDHILPISRGGTDSTDNLRLVHLGCNAERADGFFPGQFVKRELRYEDAQGDDRKLVNHYVSMGCTGGGWNYDPRTPWREIYPY